MQIGHITYTYKPAIGGIEVYVRNLVKILSNSGCSQRIYQSRTPGLQQDNLLRLIPVPYNLKRKPVYLFNLFLYTKIRDLWNEDLLVVHDPIYFWSIAWKKSVVVSHGVRWDRPPATDRLYNLVHFLSAKFAFKLARKFVANDTNFYRHMGLDISPGEKKFTQIADKKWFIPNCVDTLQFKKTIAHSDFSEKKFILIPRRVTPQRGIDIAIKAFQIFHKKNPEIWLLIAGDLKDKFQFSRTMKELVRKLGLEGIVKFYGYLPTNQMPSVYSAALMTVIPTRCEEGTSLAALESMACGTATLSTNVGGLADLPTRQCQPNEKELAELMIECYPLRELIAKEQKTIVRKVYNLDNFKKAWLEVLNSK